ncbi:MAG: L-threonylcarbamoyladenylate synthase [Deltaproteobacteria bacterium]|nr:L-threonylcarbamoyladenylate synthase [Deltaproteobacteria bacterium]
MLITISDRDVRTTALAMQIAAEAIMRGGTVVIGTETFYAIAANPFMDQAVEKIFSIKRRSFQSPLPLIAADQNFVNSKVICFSRIEETLIKRFWPGSLTILLDGCDNFSKHVRNEQGKIGVRVPTECPARRLAEKVGGWITATSANLSGEPAPEKVIDIPSEITDLVDVVIDSGPCPGGLPSTIVDTSCASWRVIRNGAVSEQTIVDTLEGSEVN